MREMFSDGRKKRRCIAGIELMGIDSRNRTYGASDIIKFIAVEMVNKTVL